MFLRVAMRCTEIHTAENAWMLAAMTTNDWPMVDVLRVKALDGHRLWVRFSDGNEGVRDLRT